ncbi:MAG: hypothetical protein ACI9C2_001169 [Gammaproteobacteria bacterium]|jgi:hypothetical protein
MSSHCQDFRRRLRDALEGGLRGERSSIESVRPLAWHEHLFTCPECRDLLEAEEALEQVLASMPLPAVPKELAHRILERLSVERTAPELVGTHGDLDSLLAKADQVEIPNDLPELVLQNLREARLAAGKDGLELLLDALPEPLIPSGLSSRVQRAVEAERTANLDALLNLIPAPEVPEGLALGILNTLEAERSAGTHARAVAPILRPRFGAVRYAAAIAATLVVAFGAWRLTSDGGPSNPQETGRDGFVKVQPEPVIDSSDARLSPRMVEEVAGLENSQDANSEIETLLAVTLPDANVLASLDVLEDWELLMSDDIDLLLGSLDEADAELLFLAGEDAEQPTEEG